MVQVLFEGSHYLSCGLEYRHISVNKRGNPSMSPAVMAIVVLSLYLTFYHFYAKGVLGRKIFNWMIKISHQPINIMTASIM